MLTDVTVVIPTHDRPHLVRQAVESVLAQTRPAARVIVVADGPDPRTRAALADFLTDPRADEPAGSSVTGAGRRPAVHLVEAPAGGVAQARNVGVALAVTDWVGFLDDDDLWHPGYLAAVAAYLVEHPQALALNAGWWTFAADATSVPGRVIDVEAATLAECLDQVRPDRVPALKGRSRLDHLDITGRSLEGMLAHMAGTMSTAVVRRELVLAARGFPAGAVCAEDWTMFTNVARLTEWHVVPGRHAFHREHATNNTVARGAENGEATLRAMVAVWDEQELPWPRGRPSRSDYRRPYRFAVRSALSSAARARRWDLYRTDLALGARLLAPLDLVRAMLPARPPLLRPGLWPRSVRRRLSRSRGPR